jgi:hypothetical protein
LDFLSLLLTPLGGNVLNLYLKSDVVVDVGRAGLLGTIVMSFPLLTHPARDLFNELILENTCWKKDSTCRHVFTTVFVVLTSLAVACVTPNIVVVWSVLGSTVAILVAYVFPPLMYMKTLDMLPSDPEQAARLMATPAPSTRMYQYGGSRTRAFTEDEEEQAQEHLNSRCLPTTLCVMGIIIAIICTAASVYNIVKPVYVAPGSKPSDPCWMNHTNHTNQTQQMDLSSMGGFHQHVWYGTL